MRSPGDFIEGSFRSKGIGKEGVRAIMGKLKSGEGSMVIQAYRFPTSRFTAEEAKRWLKDNNVKYISFEAAKKVE